MSEFLLRIKCLVDALSTCSDPVLPREHLDAILEGLPEDYEPVIYVIESKFDPLPIHEVEALLLAHESRSQKFRKKLLESPSINVAQDGSNYNSPNNFRSQVQHFNNTYSVNRGAPGYTNSSNRTGNFDRITTAYNRGGGGFTRGTRGRGGNGRGRGRYANFQCQVCLKFGHTAVVCHYRFDSDYQPNSTLSLQEPVFCNSSSTSDV